MNQSRQFVNFYHTDKVSGQMNKVSARNYKAPQDPETLYKSDIANIAYLFRLYHIV